MQFMHVPRPFGALAAATLALSALVAHAAHAQTKIGAGMVAHGPAQWPQYIATELGWCKQDKIKLDLVSAGGALCSCGGAQHSPQWISRFRACVPAGAGADSHQRHRGAALWRCRRRRAGRRPQGQACQHQARRHHPVSQARVPRPGLKSVASFYERAGWAIPFPPRLRGVDAAILNPPTYFRRPLGFFNLGDIEPYMKDVPFTVWAANTD